MSFPPDYFAGKKVTVMGLGRFGGQIAAVRYLVHQGADVTVTDVVSAEKLESSLKAIEGLDVTLHLGGHFESDFVEADLIVVSPAVSKESRYLKLASQNNVPFTCEMNLFLDRCRAKVVGVTGTVGKSTTVAMIDSIFKVAQERDFERLGYRKSWCGGNIGHSLLEDLVDIQSDDLIVLELSSFQLDDLVDIEFSPDIALVTNIYPNHLDRHKTLRNYEDAKGNITRFQREGDMLITSAEDNLDRIRELSSDNVTQWLFGSGDIEGLKVRVRKDGESEAVIEYYDDEADEWKLVVTAGELCVPGDHNLMNAAGAVSVALAVGISRDSIAEGLVRYAGLPDRLELVEEFNGVRWFNDSKSTTPESGLVALRSFSAGSVVAIAGGYDKESDLKEFAEELAKRSRMTYCMGETGGAIAELILGHGAKACVVDSLDEAVGKAMELAQAGNVVLLSPGCASWDMFTNYQERGRQFSRAVRKLTGNVGVC